ncbi:DEAD/DEAH box helicase [Paenibacillus oenotherae]|uniref:DEAD/DEAH box helicase n=2 Tax=Paenibacillus oenotherae TaxID=1435645 RepID=A0ABS7DCW5_9BACL|nr:DEAD/DEAH box helicase [Paenibacillus oenotherae]MBW7477783.1 DEAD/DEAH box helicase [Paenibacillus oenotherae]
MPTPSPALINFHPTLAHWFTQTFGAPTDVQLQAWRSILSGQHTLIAAPTGSGKTLAALLPCLNRVAMDKLNTNGGWKPGVRVLYITPLKALNNDIQHHLTGFMQAVENLQHADDSADNAAAGSAWPGIRTAVRTGDTPAHERARMIRRPPDVLVTTPESLYLLLTSDKGRGMLETVQTVIVDEIHNLAPDKRGAHLSLTLERLASLCGEPVQRIGVSATQKPLERVARFLGGWEPPSSSPAAERASEQESEAHLLGYVPRPVTIVESAMEKTIAVRVTMPDMSMLANTREAVWLPIMDRILQLMNDSRSVIIFVVSRRLCERLVLRLNDHVGYEMARAHHGSLSRERRLEVEHMLKAGELRCIVATSSLELGIDVGHIDLVIQIDSPKEAAAGIQRIGRAGHAVGDTSIGYILARNRSELPETAVLCRNIIQRDIEAITLPMEPLDVLSQQVTAIVASEDIEVSSLHALLTRSECFRLFPRARLEAALKVLAGFYPFARPLIDWDRSAVSSSEGNGARGNLLRKRANTAMAAITGAGTIPQSSAYPVHHAESRIHLGELDEEYIQESRVGDVFQLGTTSWMISSIDNDRVYVKDAPNRFSEIPFWRNEPGGRTYELGIQLGAFLRELSDRLQLAADYGLPSSAADRLGASPTPRDTDTEAAASRRECEESAAVWLDMEYGFDRTAAEELIALICSQHAALALPTDRRIVIEHYRDLMNQTRVIIHNPFGKRINRTWLLAIERQFERLLPYKLYGNAKDNGIELVLPEWDASWLEMLWHITPDSLEPLLTEAIAGSPLLAISFRRIAETSLLLSRSFTRTPMWQKRLRSEELLKQSLPYAEHFPYLQEAMRESLHLYLDTGSLKRLLGDIAAGHIDIVIHETNAPSPFAVQFIADYANAQLYEGDGLSETTQLQLMNVSRAMAGELFGEHALQRVDPLIAAEEAARLETGAFIPASADDLYTLLKRQGDKSSAELSAVAGEAALPWLDELKGSGRITALAFGSDSRWICSDEEEMYRLFPLSDRAIAFVAGRYAEHRLSFTEPELRERYPELGAGEASHIVDVLLALDAIEQAPFAESEQERIWTGRGVAKRLVRLTIEQARKRAEPVHPVRWCAHMSLLQHALSGTQLSGIDGLRDVIARLQGFFLPASHWESILFPARVLGYRKEDLDLLCSSGEVVWIGRKEDHEKEGKIAFFLAESKPLYAPYVQPKSDEASRHPALLALLREGGASFLTRLSRDCGKIPSELLADLIDLVWEGRVSNDQFAPLRLQLLAKGKGLAKTGSGQGRWYWTGSLAGGDGDSEDTASGASGELQQSALRWTQHLLESCGIVTKDLVTQLSPYGWDELTPVLRQYEHWGIVTRGLLIQGVNTLQFAKRELLSAIRQPFPGQESDAITVISAIDPANPFGLAADWPSVRGASFSRKSGNFLVLYQGRWRYWLENNGRKVVELSDERGESSIHHLSVADDVPDPKLLKQIFRTIMRQHGLSKIKIERWNGADITDSNAAAALRAIGAERDNRTLVLWPSQLQ